MDRQQINRDAFINALYNNDMVEIHDDLIVELIDAYDTTQRHIESMRLQRLEEYRQADKLSLFLTPKACGLL